MRKSSGIPVIPIALLLICGSASAQTGVEADRLGRRCTTATLSTDPAAPCPDDVLNDTSAPQVIRPPSGLIAPTIPIIPPAAQAAPSNDTIGGSAGTAGASPSPGDSGRTTGTTTGGNVVPGSPGRTTSAVR